MDHDEENKNNDGLDFDEIRKETNAELKDDSTNQYHNDFGEIFIVSLIEISNPK